MQADYQAAGKIRQFIWPIFGKEHKKFLPMTFMISLILFNYTVMRNMKDTLVIASTGGSEIVTFLKVWAVLPAAIVFFIVFTKLSNIFSRQNLFYITVSFFLAFFAIFALVLYPMQDSIHPIAFADNLMQTLPAGMKSFVDMIKYWSFSLFYIMAELWGSVVASLLFWQFANGIVGVKEAKRFYAHFYLLANLATAFSGIITKYFSKMGNEIADPTLSYGVTVNYLMAVVVVCGLLVMAFYKYMDTFVVNDPLLVDPKDVKPQKKKLKMGIGESIKFILSSKYLGLIVLLVISYGISINLVEVAWKNQVKTLYPIASDYNAFMGTFSFIGGITSFVVILIGGELMRLLGWRVAALATPIVIGLTGALFFYFMIYEEAARPVAAMLGTTALVFAVGAGMVQNLLSKSTKYALFDPTKEMAYIPLDDESKLKGKAAVDVVGGRFGKAGGAVLQQMMFIFIGPISVIAPYSAIIMIAMVAVWIWAVFALNKLFKAAGGE